MLERSANERPARPQSMLASRCVDLCVEVVSVAKDNISAQEAIFAELDPLLDAANPQDISDILQSSVFQTIKDEMHSIRAAYEYDREMLLADEIIAKHSADVAEEFRSHDWYDKALDFETKALAPYACKSILFVGSGPFPTSPMAFLRNNPAATVTCMERFPDACARARQVADIFELPDLEIIHADGADEKDFSSYDCVIVGLVVGAVDDQKNRIVDHFLKQVPKDTLLCFRTADGSGKVIYPSVNMEDFEDIPHKALEGPPHKSFTMVIVDRSAAK